MSEQEYQAAYDYGMIDDLAACAFCGWRGTWDECREHEGTLYCPECLATVDLGEDAA